MDEDYHIQHLNIVELAQELYQAYWRQVWPDTPVGSFGDAHFDTRLGWIAAARRAFEYAEENK